jgi:hypothetical protein
MNAERFEHLAAAYGGDLRRWPAVERDAALAGLAADQLAAERILFAGRQVDAALEASPRPQVSQTLRDAILAAAPQPEPIRERRGKFEDLLFGAFGRGLALAGLGCAAVLGVGVGAMVTQGVIDEAQADAVIAESAALSADELEILG